MLLALASTALFMGLTGGAHCLVMCAAPCAALTGQLHKGEDEGQAVAGGALTLTRIQGGGAAPARRLGARLLGFHLGRLLGYGAAGALAALAMDRLVWLADFSPGLRPLWTLMHVLILAWGLLMLLQARQPAWIEGAGRTLWQWVRPWTQHTTGLFVTGMAWALLPCGLLYSALLMAALSGSVVNGFACMALFGLGSALWLTAGPWALGQLHQRLAQVRAGLGMRVAGAILCTMGAWALWMDVVHGQPAPWCVS